MGDLWACLPREEEGLPVHDHRILRDGRLELQENAAMVTRNTRHDPVEVERREHVLWFRLRHGCSALQASPGLCQNSPRTNGRWACPCRRSPLAFELYEIRIVTSFYNLHHALAVHIYRLEVCRRAEIASRLAMSIRETAFPGNRWSLEIVAKITPHTRRLTRQMLV
jgi:hypothetical protein